MSRDEEFCPYVGLQPFREEDRDYFFGRSRDQRVIISNLYASSLTVLYGASGVGKSSVLLAGVVPKLRESPNTAVAVFRDWAHTGFQDELKRACIDAIGRARPDSGIIDCSQPLDRLLSQGAKTLKTTVLVILDQFEEYFLYHPESESGNTFDEEFARAVNSQDVDAGFLIALREDGVAKLDRFRARIPSLLGNTLRLRHLDEQSAREAIRLPVEEVYNARFPDLATSVEDDLVTALIEEVRGRQIGAMGGVGKVAGTTEQAWIETALLQLLLTKLWKTEPRPQQRRRVLRLQTFRDMGGAEKVVERHLAELMAALSPEQLELCAHIFDRLVTPSGTKVACRDKDLVKWAGDLASHLPEVLHLLSTGETRILRPVAAAPGDKGGPQYEIFHDVLAGAILSWRAGYLAQKERAALERHAEEQRRRAEEQGRAASRLARALWRARAFTVIALLTAAAAWIYERQAATQTKLASSRALATSAINQALTDSELGVLLALHAVKTARTVGDDATREAADALGRAIASTRVRTSKKVDISLQGDRFGFSPDHKRLLVSGDNRTLRVLRWPEVREEAILLQSQDAEFRNPTFAPTGRLVAANASDETLRIWDAATGKLKHSLKLPGKPGTLRFSADGSMIAVGGQFTAWVWRVGEEDPVVTIAGHLDSSGTAYTVTAVAFHPLSPVLATAAWDNTVRLWSLRTGEQLAVLRGHTAVIDYLEFSPDGKELLSASQDRTTRIWSAATGRHRVTLYGHSNSIFSASYSRDGKKIVTASADTTARIWDADSGRELALLSSHREPVSWAQFADEDRLVVTTSWDRTVKTWSASGHTGRVRSTWFSPDGRVVATAGEDRMIHLWDAVSGDELRRLIGHRDAVSKMRFSRGGTRLVSGDVSGRVIVWDPSTGRIVASLCCQRFGIEGIAVSPDGLRVVSAAGSDGVVVWNVREQVLEATLLTRLAHNAEKVEYSPDGHWIVATTNDGTLWIWSAENLTKPRRVKAHSHDIFFVTFSPDSKTILTGAADHLVKLWDVTSGKMRREPTRHGAIAVNGVFTPDGSRIITSDLKGAIIVSDTATGERLSGPSAHASMSLLELSEDGTLLASFSWDRTAKVWDTKSWRQLATLTHREQIDHGGISPDGTHLVTATPSDGVRILPLDLNNLIRLAKTRVTRDLTAQECRRYLQLEDCPALP